MDVYELCHKKDEMFELKSVFPHLFVWRSP